MKNYWSKLPTTCRGAIVLSIPALCLVVTLGAWVWSSGRETALNKQINHTQKVITQSNELLIALLNAETGVRGYNISRNEGFLEPYQIARNALPAALGNLEQLIPNKSQQQQRLTEIEQLSWQRMAILEQIVKLTKLAQPQNQLSQFNDSLHQGKETMDRLRMMIASLQKDEQNLLKIRQQNLNNARKIASSIQWSAAAISAISYAAVIYLFDNLEENLSESQTIIEAIVTNVVDGVVTLTKQGKIETFNQAASKMFGYETDEVIGKNLTMLITGCLQYEHQEQESNFQNACQIELNRPWQTQGNPKTGKPFPIEISLSNMQLDNRLIAIIRDITERQEAEEKLKARAVELARLGRALTQTNEELAEKNQELEQFAYVASHDLKAPLRAIANLSEWIEEDLKGQLPPENQRQMELLRERVYRLEALINGLLEYYRAGQTRVATEIVNTNALLAEIIDSLAPPSTFKIEIQPGMPTLQTKRVPLSQVFSNFIGNAIKYHHRRDAHIKISYQDQGEFYEFAVADDGPGIAPEHHEKVFAVFQTLQPRDRTESTGIGLAIVKKIVETEGGSISLESKLEEGAIFRFTWLKETTKN
jgi:PAS domain S-box-containing protein